MRLVASPLFISLTLVINLAPALANFAAIDRPELNILSPALCRTEFAQVRLASKSQVLPLTKSLNTPKQRPAASFFDRVPDGTMERRGTVSCTPERLEAMMIRTGSAAQQAHGLREFFRTCQDQLTQFTPPSLLALGWFAGSQYELCDHPEIRKFALRLPDNRLLRGYLGLKPGSSPRPLVIVRCGAFCNAGDVVTRMTMMHLFDESPFHVLSLGNITGTDYFRDNQNVAMGGFDEGQQALQIARLVREIPALADRVSTIHYVGVSLGGHSALFAARFATQLASQRPQTNPFASVLAICPVVDLDRAMIGLFSGSSVDITRSFFLDSVFKMILPIPGLRFLFSGKHSDENQNFLDNASRAAARYYASASRSPDRNLGAAADISIRSTQDLWSANRFSRFAHEPMHVPLLAIASRDDSIVDAEEHTAVLARAFAKSKSPNAGAALVDSGSHCALSVAYGHGLISSLYRSYILSHSPELLARKRKTSLALPAAIRAELSQLWPQQTVQMTKFEFRSRDSLLRVTFKFFNSFVPECDLSPAYAAPSCFGEIETQLPMSAIRAPWARVPRSDAEAQALTRWANVNVRLEGSSFSWLSYE